MILLRNASENCIKSIFITYTHNEEKMKRILKVYDCSL